MDLLSLGPFPAALLVWQLTPSRWVITVVCKATYALVPGVVAPAAEQEPLHDEDAHWDDDPKRSLFAPADLVPFKPRADVALVGSAFARGGQPARSIVARLSVGKIDKSIEVLCPRVRTRDGELREGKRWIKMPLLYEKAAGGPDTENPAGIHIGGPRDPFGQLHLPNLQPPGLKVPVDKLPPSIGFGPIAASWPGRAGRLPRGHEERDWARAPFGEGFDPAYFQSAPPDQQLDALRPTERIALENLLAQHPSLVTSLPGDRVRARVEVRGAAPREINLVADSLWIDTDRAICTVTFRGKVDVDHPEQEGRILVATSKNDQPIPWARIAPAPPAPSQPPPKAVSVPAPPARPSAPPAKVPPPPRNDDPPDSKEEPFTVDIDADVEAVEITSTELPGRHLAQTAALRPITALPAISMSESPALPFQPAPPGWTPPAAVPSRPGLPPFSNVPPDLSTTPAFGAPVPRGTLPDWFESGHAPPPAPAIEVPRVAPPPLISSPAWSALSPSAVTPSPNVPLLVPAPVDGPLGALEASNAAAGLVDAAPVRVEPEPAAPAASPGPAPASPAAVVVELIWFDPPAAQRLTQHPLFAPLCRPVTAPKAPEAAPDARSAEDAARAAAYDVLTRAAPTPAAALDGVLEGAEDESPPSPALVVVTGTLEMGLDEVESLKALSAAASPLAGSDKKLKEAIDVAAEALKTPMQGMPDFAEGLGARIRDAWSRANRALPPEHLANCTERLLLEQRAYQKRELLDDTWIRALLTGEGPSVPVYLPARLAKRLPLFRRFPARLLAEIVWQQDQYESHPLALRTLALGRLPPRARQPASRPRRRP